MKKITNEQLDSLIRSAMNSSGPLPADEKFAQIISALRELRELRESNDQRGDGDWIKCSEKIPPDREVVILWDADLDEATAGHFSHQTNRFYTNGMKLENEITHWQPAPPKPEESCAN